MKLFVANIERRVTEAELKTIFSACGEVESVKIITDRATGSPKGFGFVEMPNDAEAQRAIDSINEKEVGGRQLAVAQAKPKSFN
jgi:RNA recognition motif-containing protein